MLHLCHISPLFREHACSARPTSIVGELFDETPVVLTSLLFNKPGHVGEALSLHQDLPYYPYLADDDLITSWMALDRVDTENGCLEYLPGSHRARIWHRKTGGQQALEIPADVADCSDVIAVPLEPGDAVVHHGLTAHRSAANRSSRSRMGLATLYLRQSAKVSHEDFMYRVLVPRTAGSDADA